MESNRKFIEKNMGRRSNKMKAKMQVGSSKFNSNSFQFFNFTFILLSPLSFKAIQFRPLTTLLLLSMQLTNE